MDADRIRNWAGYTSIIFLLICFVPPTKLVRQLQVLLQASSKFTSDTSWLLIRFINKKQPSVCPVQQLDLLMKRGYRPLSLGQRLISSTRTSSAFDKRKTEIPFVFLSLSLSAVVCVLALRSSCKSLSLKGRRRMEERQRKERSRKWIYAIGSASE